MAFVPCPSCRRHVRAGDSSCPFCASALPSDARGVPSANKRLGRTALFAFAAISAGVAAGCSSSDSGPGTVKDSGTASDGTPEDTGGGMALYGAPADTGVPDTGADTNDSGGPAPAYGLPPDAG